MNKLCFLPVFGALYLGLANAAHTTLRDSEIYFGGENKPGISQYHGRIFTETQHFVSPEDSYAGISTLEGPGIVVRAGLTRSADPAKWLIRHAKSPFYDTGSEVPERFRSAYFSILGNLEFHYLADSQAYACNGVGLMFGAFSRGPAWLLFSNLAPGFFTSLDGNPVEISCVQQRDGHSRSFVATALDANHFSLVAKPSGSRPEEFSDEALAETLTAGFNSIASARDRNRIFSNGIYGVDGARNFVIHNPRDFALTRVRENARQTDIRPLGEKALWTDVSELPNETPVNQTFSSTSHSLAVTNSVTTTSTSTVGGSLEVSAETGLFDIVGLGSKITGSYSHAWGKQVTTSTTEQYTTPPEPILVPPFCKAMVTQSLSQTTFEGSYEFDLAMQGYATADGMAFWVLDPDMPAPDGAGSGMSGFSAPTSYQDWGGTAGRIDIYETLANASTPQALDPRIRLDPQSRAVVFKGAGRFSGSAGTYYTMRVRFEPTRSGISCGPPTQMRRALGELRSVR